MAGKQGNISRMAMKAMGLFGGVQVAGILCSIIRTKLVALWIGPVGIGLFGLFNNALEMISTGTNLGIRSSSVRDISQAMDRSDKSLVARMVTVVRKWSMWLGLAGALLTLVLAPLLSQVTFGDSLHIWGFVALSVAVLLQALTNGEYAVLQGTARLKRLASVTLWGTLVGLAVSIPLFYLLRERSILPSILAYALALAAFAWIFRNRDYAPAAVSRRETFDMGKGFVRLGIYMTLGNFATILAKGDGKTYLWTEVASAVINLVLNIVFYRWWGLTGLGIAFLVSYLLYTLIIAVVYFKTYRLSVSRASLYNLLWTLAVAAGVMAAMECGITAVAVVLTVISIAVAARLIVTMWRR